MLCLMLRKKHLPTKKEWKGFISKLQSKLHQFSKSKAFKTTTLHYINPLLPPKLHFLPEYPTPKQHYCHQCCRRLAKDGLTAIAKEFVAKPDLELHGIHVFHLQMENIQANGLTDEPSCENEAKTAPPAMAMQGGHALERSTNESLDKSRAVSLQLHGVDARAEKFINKIHTHFMLEREESLERYNYYAMWPYITYFDPNC